MQKKIQKFACNWFKNAIFKQFSHKWWNNFTYQFPKLRHSEIIEKIMKKWDSMIKKNMNIYQLIQLCQSVRLGLKHQFSQAQGPIHHIWQDQVDSDDEFILKQQKNDIKMKAHKYIQKHLNCGKIINPGPTKNEILSFNYLKENQQLNEDNFIYYTKKMSNKNYSKNISDQLHNEDEKIIKNLSSKVRIFQQKIDQKIYYQNHGDFKPSQTRQFTFKQRQKNEQQQSQISIQIQISGKKKRRIKKNKNKIKKFGSKGINVIYLTHQNRKKYLFCQKCFVLVRHSALKQHGCVKEHNFKIVKNKILTTDSFIPLYSHSKKLFGYCLQCKKFGHRCNDHEQIYPNQIFFQPVQPIFILKDKNSFYGIDLLVEHLSQPAVKSDILTFYEQIDLGQIPEMVENSEKIKLINNYVLSSFAAIPKNIIFGPLGTDALPEYMFDKLSWNIKYFANKWIFNGKAIILAPFFRMNGAGFLVSKQEAGNEGNIQVLAGFYKQKCHLFGYTLRRIEAGEEIVIK